jgi:hypothetical protein
VEEDVVLPHRGEPLPYVRHARHEAERARHALAVEVRPVLVLVGAAHLDVSPLLRDVRVLADGDLGSLTALGGLLKPADIDTLHTRARNRHTWLRA